MKALGLAGTTAVGLVVAVTLVGAAPGYARHRPHHAGCGSFCQQAGGVGASPGPAPAVPMKFFGRLLHVRGGAVRIDVQCILETRCVGAVGVWADQLADDSNPVGRLGAVDISIPEGERMSVTVPLSARSLRLIRQRPSRSVPAAIEGFEKGRCSGPNDCATAGEASRSVRITLS